MRMLSPLSALRMKVLSVPLFIRLFTTSTMISATWASLETPEPTKRYWQNQLQQQQVSTFTDDSGFTVNLPAADVWIANDYANTGADAT